VDIAEMMDWTMTEPTHSKQHK